MKKTLKTEAIQMKGGNKTIKKNNEVSHRFPVSPFPRFFLPAVITLALCLVGASGAWASLGINLTGGNTWSLPNISPESTHESTITWQVENIGTEAEDVSISVANSANWQVASAPDVDKFVLDHNAYGSYKNVTNSGVSLKDNLEASGTKDFKLQFTAPQSGSVGSEQSITVTLAAQNQWTYGPLLSDIDTHYGRIDTTQQVVITGTGFEDPARVRLNKTGETSIVDETPTYTSGTSLTADLTIPADANEGIYTIEVENTSTGDRSPAKTASDGNDCFFGVAAPDADEWTDDPCLITEGVKVGNSSLHTLTGTMGTISCLPCQVSGTIGTLIWSSCEVFEDPAAGGRKYHRYTDMLAESHYFTGHSASVAGIAAAFCRCIHPDAVVRSYGLSAGTKGDLGGITADCTLYNAGWATNKYLITIDCW